MKAEELILKIANEAGITTDEILSTRRSKHLVEIRLKIMRELRSAGMTFVRIGDLLNREYSTIRHHLAKDWGYFQPFTPALLRKCKKCHEEFTINRDDYEIGHAPDCPL